MYETRCQSRFDARYWMLGASALGRLRGMVWGEEGGGFRMGNTCIPVVDSFWYLAKLIQLCNYVKFKNKIKFKKIKIIWKGKKNMNNSVLFSTFIVLCKWSPLSGWKTFSHSARTAVNPESKHSHRISPSPWQRLIGCLHGFTLFWRFPIKQ